MSDDANEFIAFPSGWYRIPREGWTEDEIIDDIKHTLRVDDASLTRRDRRLWADREAQWRTQIRSFLDTPAPPRQAPPDTPENVRAERERRKSAGELYGYDTLAEFFVTTPETIRRRLGKLK